MTSSDVRIVKDVRSGGQSPSHILERGETEALCGQNCSGYTYSIYNPEKALEDPFGRTLICKSCYETYQNRNGR